MEIHSARVAAEEDIAKNSEDILQQFDSKYCVLYVNPLTITNQYPFKYLLHVITIVIFEVLTYFAFMLSCSRDTFCRHAWTTAGNYIWDVRRC